MGWEMRNGKCYYYQKQREGRRVTSVYWGAGAIAELAAVQAEHERAQRQVEREQAEQEQQCLQTPEALRRYHDAVQRAVAGLLESIGYRRHQRGAWRLQR